jgi:hypothetical protein
MGVSTLPTNLDPGSPGPFPRRPPASDQHSPWNPRCPDGVAIEVIHGGHDAVTEFSFGCDVDIAQTERASVEKKSSTRVS